MSERQYLKRPGALLTALILLSVLLILNGLKCRGRSPSLEQEIDHTKHMCSNLFYAVGFLLKDTKWLPDSSIGLGFLLEDPGVQGWDGPYYEAQRTIVDSWGSPMRFHLESDTVVLMSAGPDMKWQTHDDIRSVRQMATGRE